MDPLTLLDLDKGSDAPFVLTREETYTRGQLLKRAAAVGCRLKEMGITRGNVIVSLDSSPGFVAGLVGCWLAGATPVLLDPLVRRELGSAIEMTRAEVVIRGTKGVKAPPNGAKELVVDPREEIPFEAPGRPARDPIVYLFTSGSTGKPTLVPKSFEHLDVEIRFLRSLFSEPKRVATLVPWCHIFGFIVSFLVPCRLRGVCDLTAGISPKSVLEKAGAGQLDLIVAVPAVYKVMVRYLESGNLPSIPSTCCFATSGAPVSDPLRDRFTELTGCRLTDLYGSTEAGGVAYRHDNGPWIVQPHVEMRISPQGFLEVCSPSVSFGEPDSFYRIGDLVRLEDRGFVLVGRKDDVVKIGGRRVALGEVLEVVEACPSVLNAAVLASEVRGEIRLVAYVERDADNAGLESIKTFVRERVADHKVPQVIKVVEQLPRTPAGKIDRQKLKSMDLE